MRPGVDDPGVGAVGVVNSGARDCSLPGTSLRLAGRRQDREQDESREGPELHGGGREGGGHVLVAAEVLPVPVAKEHKTTRHRSPALAHARKPRVRLQHQSLRGQELGGEVAVVERWALLWRCRQLERVRAELAEQAPSRDRARAMRPCACHVIAPLAERVLC